MKRLIFTLTGISLLDDEKELLGTGRNLKDNLNEINDWCNLEDIITDNTLLEDRKRGVLDALANKNLRDEYADFSAEIASLSLLKPNNAVDNKDDKIIFIVTQTPECAFAGIVNAKFIIYRRTNNRDWSSIVFKKSNEVFSCDNVEIKIIDGLQVEKGGDFASVGIKNLFTFVSNKIENEGASYDEIIFNITGGYKGTIPYLTLFGMLYQEKEIKGKRIKPSIEYLYEKSKDIITLPNLPIAFDIFTWRNYRGFIKTINHLEADVAKLFLDNILPEQISGLFEEVKDEYHLTKLGEILEGRYDEEKEGELTPYGRGYLLTDEIKDDQKQKALRDCINRWQYLWLGDLIPETVEHARGHTQRVLELAAQILYPILKEEKNFFGDKYQTANNLLALISAIWLHDLGHSGNYVKCKQDKTTIRDVPDEEIGSGIIEYDIKGFPSQVRDMHHILSWYLIGKDRVELFDRYLFSWDSVPGDDNERLRRFLSDDLEIGWIKNAKIPIKSDGGKTIIITDENEENSAEITMDAMKEKAALTISNGRTHELIVKMENGKLKIYKSNSAFDDNLIEAVRQICLYHRGKMPALENHKPFEHIGIEIKEPLENLSSTKVNLPLLGALLRIADGGDVQEERTISENYKDMRFLQNRREIEQLEQEEREYREKVDALFDASLSSQLPEHLAEFKNFACEYFSNDSTERDNQYEKIAKMVCDCVRKYIGGEGLECIVGVRKIILRNWLSALDQYVFKKSTDPHFKKHAGISAVMYLLDELKEKKDKKEYHYKVRAIHKKGKVENAEGVLKDIFCEYTKVEKNLNAHRIYFDSYERMEEEENGERKPVQFNEKDC